MQRTRFRIQSVRSAPLSFALFCLALLSAPLSEAQQVSAWGYNYYGQLGNGAFTPADPFGIATAAPVSGLTDVIALACGYFHNLALTSNGRVWTWGANAHGQLGNGAFTTTAPEGVPNPALVSGLTNIVTVAGGRGHSLALASDGRVWSWGRNDYGQLGNGAYNDAAPFGVATPALVPGLTNVIAIAGGNFHSIALTSDGNVWTWGANYRGQLGNGAFNPNRTATPALVSGLTNVVAIAGGGDHSLALTSDGKVWAWGYNARGQLGKGTFTNGAAQPGLVSGLSGVVAIASRWEDNLALTSEGRVWTWGANGNGQLGNGAYNDVAPFGVATPAPALGVTNITAIASAGSHNLALAADGRVWAWGGNYYGQLGNGAFTTAAPYGNATPALVPGLSGVTAIAAGWDHSLALTTAPASLRSVSGSVALAQCLNPQQPLTFQFFPARGNPFMRRATLNANGGFSLANIPAGSYSVRVKGGSWLARRATADVRAGNVSNLQVTLVGGDANNDNSVDLFDLVRLFDRYGASSGEADYDAGSDLNCDNAIDLLDLVVLFDHYGEEGEP